MLFHRGQGDLPQIKPGGKTLTVTVGDGLPKTSKPTRKTATQSHGRGRNQPASRGHQNGAAQFSRGMRAPPPPSDTYSAPSKYGPPPSTALPKLGSQKSRRAQGHQQAHQQRGNLDFLNVPDQGMSGKRRKSSVGQRPAPAVPSSRPKVQQRPQGPRCRALYQYIGQDTDEISFEANDTIDLINEDPSGWWRGRIRGKEGLFPGNYVEKI